jgi:uroporphyrinogen III methyltransferase / synthase
VPKRSSATGFVSLVGAGPGSPGLLTLAGRRALERADVVLYDHLASPALMSSVPVAGQERIHVGKTAEAGFATQVEINALIVRRARAGQRVVRLKGGDPFIFGRGGEEAQVCASADVPYEVIAGVSAITGALAAAGIPLTHRALASSFTVVTGHERSDGKGESVDWRALSRVQGTLVVLMGVLQVGRWTKALLDGGMPATAPVAFIRWGTTSRQETLSGTLGTIAARVVEANFRAPAIAVVGAVVGLRPALHWLEERPLFREVIALTRSSHRDTQDFEALEDLGATVVHLPLTHQVRCGEGAALVSALKGGGFTDLVVTSANGVRALAEGLEDAGLDARDLKGVRTWCVGPATGRALKRIVGVRPDEVPPEASGEGLVAHAAGVGVKGRTFLFPAAAGARRVVPEGLRGLGATVLEIAAYETHPLDTGPADLQSALDEGLSLVALASPTAVEALVKALDTLALERDAVAVAVIGPTTAAAARGAGLTVRVEAETHTMPGLAAAIVATTTARNQE